jgi:hypothetical protein
MAGLNLKQYKVCFDRSPVAFCVIRVTKNKKGAYNDFIFEYVNESLAKLEGLTIANMVGKHFYHIFYNASVKWLQPYGKAAHENISSDFVQFSPEINKYLHIQCYQVDEGYAAVVLVDVSDNYRFMAEELKTLIALDVNTTDMYQISISDDFYTNTFSRRKESVQEAIQGAETGKLTELIKALSEQLVFKAERRDFVKVFSLENLHNSLIYGNRNVVVQKCFANGGGHQIWLQIMVRLRLNPLTQKTEGVLRIKDVTLPVVKSKTLQRLADDEYDYLGIIDPSRSVLTLNFVNHALPDRLTSGIHLEGKEMDFEEERNFVADSWIMPEDRAEFLKKSTLKKITAEVKKSGKYVFYARALRDGVIHHKCFRYTYLDENELLILFKQRDVTDMFH